ncbi:MaoC family dehydratase N-terminal domain-containing protein [Nocardia sp. BMG51109]|uniref:FAS1-like dehydratase domain-containing protein n=1 Tax=Nocardia sp. BMG51109 TaxID=1056816 RepID=UPI0004675BAE|nr:MaoC family dehydratase N-terminal domain-containing protein [Nocardia sp. BMG51109]
MSAPRESIVERVVDPVAVAGLAGLLGATDLDLRAGAALPPLWHWATLARWPAPHTLGPDGHPLRGTGIMPDVALPRRMFGGGSLTFHAPIPVGDEVTVTSRASEPRERDGRTGPLVLVDLTVQVHDRAGTLLLEEIQNIVYTSARTQSATVEPSPAPLAEQLIGPPRTTEAGETRRDLRTDPVHLARFSALTANSHRIHIDWPYATGVEGYPGLVVHGPLMAVALAETARRAGAPTPGTLRHRGLAPLFCGERAELVARQGTGPVLEVVSPAAEGEEPRVHARLELDPAPSTGARPHRPS